MIDATSITGYYGCLALKAVLDPVLERDQASVSREAVCRARNELFADDTITFNTIRITHLKCAIIHTLTLVANTIEYAVRIPLSMLACVFSKKQARALGSPSENMSNCLGSAFCAVLVFCVDGYNCLSSNIHDLHGLSTDIDRQLHRYNALHYGSEYNNYMPHYPFNNYVKPPRDLPADDQGMGRPAGAPPVYSA